jgi:hypothetical protein
MTTEARKKGSKQADAESIEEFYVSEEAKNPEYADHVRFTTTPHGMLLSFGKWRRDQNKFGIFKEILLPYPVAASLSEIIGSHLQTMIEEGKLIRVRDSERAEE